MTEGGGAEAAQVAAWQALRSARLEAPLLSADRWEVKAGRRFGWASAAQVDAAAKGLLLQHDLEVEFLGSAAGTYPNRTVTRWAWLHVTETGVWRSGPVEVTVQEDQGSPGSSHAAVTASRKIFLRQLLGLEVEDAEAGLNESLDRVRVRVPELAAGLLAAYCKRERVSAESILAQTFPSLADQAAKVGAALSLDNLTTPQLWMLGFWLTSAGGSRADLKWRPGEVTSTGRDDELGF